MAIIPNKKEFVESVGIVIEADLKVEEVLFPATKLHATDEIVYDTATVEGTPVAYNSFRNTANVVRKNGKDKVTINPIQLNDSISKGVIEANQTMFGENEYGEGTVDAVTQSALAEVGAVRLNHLATKKTLIYEALTTHQIAEGYDGANGKEDIVFAVPAANKVVFDGVTAGQLYWATANATVLDNVVTAYNAMKVKPSVVVMNDTTYSNFYNNSQVLTADNSTDGTKKNFVVNEDVDPNDQFFRAGRIMYKGIILDVWVERETKSDGNPYLADGYVIYTKPVGEMHYGGIPVAQEGVGVINIRAEWDASEEITSNPPQHNVVVRTAPLPVLKNGQAYYSQKVEA